MFSFHHVSLSVQNLESSIEFYSTFGFEPVYEWQAEDKRVAIVHLKMDEMLLELFCFADASAAPESSKELATDLPRIGIKHFGIRVADIHVAREALQAAGLADGVEVVEGKTGIQYFFIKDPSGILVEIVQDDRGL
ncbi:VOC family protein [Mariprofundus sp. KV]|uniref:VOC family protein n=1 Tax=Mariprofundus sp. KV TaxID=2608715 RepID=UPI0015A40D86|nr:VOC family protein [Mariprofundus sp. KV]NWF37227.1 glyoxalase/bleomycin resistance/dioxygenase family protein [Mariprofundus sp. KV]